MTSRFERLNAIEKSLLIVLAVGIANLLLPFTAAAQSTDSTVPTANKTAIVFEINNLSTIKIPINYSVTDDDNAPSGPTPEAIVAQQEQIFEQNVAILQDYLNSKGSPLADHAATLLKQDNWQLVVAVSNGESTMCKHEMYNNCWGIGGAWNLKRYKNLDDGIMDVSQLITNKYVADGLDTPQEMVYRYVGHSNSNWVYAANKTLAEINTLPLQLN